MTPRSLLLPLLLVLAGCASQANQSAEHESPLFLTWEVVENHVEGRSAFRSRLTFVNEGTWNPKDWTLYFNFERTILPESVPDVVQITHINGDFYRLTPAETFPALAPVDSLSLAFEASDWAIKEIDAPSGAYLVVGAAPPVPVPVRVRPFRSAKQSTRMPGDVLPVPTAALRYHDNEALRMLPAEALSPITPTPRIRTPLPGAFTLTAQTPIRFGPRLEAEAAFLADALTPLLDERPEIAAGGTGASGRIVLRIAPAKIETDGSDEAYRLDITPNGIEIAGAGTAGVFYGVQSLRALIPDDGSLRVPSVHIEDAPRFAYRGMHLDVARNFRAKAEVEKLLDLMAFYKLNAFHFHLTDDEGWRLEIPDLPELTAVGSRRGHTLDEHDRLVPSFGSGPFPDRPNGSGHYSRSDFIEILRYAHARHIEVIPEINLPGHARAAIKAMEARAARLHAAGKDEEAEAFRLLDPDDASVYRSVQGWSDNVIDVCRPAAYRFVEAVIDDLAAMYAEAEAPLSTIHTGGDEVPHGAWTRSPACAALIGSDAALASTNDLPGYFLHRVVDLLDARGLTTAGWEEVALTEDAHGKVPNRAFAARHVRPYVWNNVWGWGGEEVAYRLANAGFSVVLSNATNLYFDLANDKDPAEPGFYWAAFVPTRAPFDFTPMDIYRSADTDRLGHAIPPDRYAHSTRLTAEGREHILGIQGQLWGETIHSPAQMEYMAFPRLISLAERAWAAPPEWALIADPAPRTAARDPDWESFANRLGQIELPRLDRFDGGTAYRIPLPGAVIEDGILHANVSLPGLSIRFTTDGAEPTPQSPLYTRSVSVQGKVRVRVFDTRGRGSRTVVVND